MKPSIIMALDQGTTSSRAVLFDANQNILAFAYKEFTQFYPQAGYVEHDAEEIYSSQVEVMNRVLRESGIPATDITAIGITNQRETTIIWEKKTGRPIHNAIVWQCRRTAPQCEKMKEDGCEKYVRENTGLIIDAYFSATKVKWLLDNIPGARERAKRGELLFGTIDTWLIWRLTNGRVHATDFTNASRTMMFNIRTLDWDDNILYELDIPRCILPEVVPSSHIFGTTQIEGVDIPIASAVGDQQAALFGQKCFRTGDVKNTYGTGCFMLMNIGQDMLLSKNGLLTTLSAVVDRHVDYVLEGSVFSGGAVIQWLRDEMGLIKNVAESEFFACQVPDNGGVTVVPAFTGLGAPYWDMYARGAILGLTRGTGKNHIVRAALESIAFQTRDLMDAMSADTGITIDTLRVDGGASTNNFLMQFQSDILGCEVVRSTIMETTSLGAAYLAGLAVGIWDNTEQIRSQRATEHHFTPNMTEDTRMAQLSRWHRAVERSRSWVK
ncbi:MAG: glycerol kinase [Clostridiales bacterium GWF2_36_10]|nr:MAG: glycerol kinase [Clostridiales bacterium GWF2_36_10]HAN21870.1 glycerol kinase [Clostridiales bacterium]